jgi:hypothetical protein
MLIHIYNGKQPKEYIMNFRELVTLYENSSMKEERQ